MQAPVQRTVQRTVVEPEPKKLAVRLRAIPMDEQMIRGQQVDVRFREHTPAPQNIAAPQNVRNTQLHARTPRAVVQQPIATRQPSAVVQKPIAFEATPQLELAVPKQSTFELPVSTPNVEPAQEHTARAKTATPPWRIK